MTKRWLKIMDLYFFHFKFYVKVFKDLYLLNALGDLFGTYVDVRFWSRFFNEVHHQGQKLSISYLKFYIAEFH